MKRFFSMAAVLMLCGITSFAQYTNDLENGAEQTVTNAWDADTIWVGNTTPSNTLNVIDGGTVTSTNIYVGATSNATDNALSVTGTGSLTVDDTLTIGTGTNNAVSVGSGGTISVGTLSVDSGNAFNLDSGGTLSINGDYNADAQTNVNWNSGGTLTVDGTLTKSNGLDGVERTLVLQGTNASWTLGGDLAISGTNNTLSIINGGSVSDANAYIGFGSNAKNNSVMVSGAGSKWVNSGGALYVGGVAQSGSSLTVSDDAWVYVGEASTNDIAAGIGGGVLVASTNGAVMIVDNDSTVETTGGLYIGGTNAALTGTVTVTNGSTIEAASLTIGNTSSELNIENGGTLAITGTYDADAQTNVNWNSGGTLSVGGKLTKSNGLDGVGRKLVINGGSWDLGGDLTVTGTNNTLSITSGGAVTNDNGYVGYAASDTNNSVAVSGSGSLWLNNGTLYIGSTNELGGNSVSVSSGGRVQADGLSITDGNTFNLNSGGTLAVMTDFDVSVQTNLAWKSGGNLSIGPGAELFGMGVTNLVVDGSTNTYTHLGSGRDLTIDGGIWKAGGNDLYVGTGTAGSDLVVENGGWVNVGDVPANLAGGGSMLVASTNGAQLVVANGSVKIEDTLYLGLGSTTGTNIILSGGTVSVGALEATTDSLLDLRSGGTFAIASGFDASIDQFSWGTDSTLSVGGKLTGMDVTNGLYYLNGGRDLTLDGGSWNIGDTNLVIGYGGSGSVLTIKNKGMLNSGTTYIGWDTNSANNSVVVSSGGVWTNSGDLWIGYGGTGNKLSILSGGTNLVEGDAYIGTVGTSANTASVSGSNALWSIDGDLSIGGISNSVGNELSVSEGGLVVVDGAMTLNSSNSIALATGGSMQLASRMNVLSNANISGAGTISFGTNDALLAFIGDEITVDSGIVFLADAGSYNTVTVTNGTFTVAGSTTNQYENFDLLSLYKSDLTGSGSLDGFSDITLFGGTITPGGTNVGTLAISGALTVLDTGAPASNTTYKAQILDTTWDQLAFTSTNSVDLSNLGIDVYMPLAPTGGVATIITAEGGIDNSTFAYTNIEDRLLLYKAGLELTNGELNVVVTQDDAVINSTMDFAATESVRAGFSGMKNMVFTRTKQLRRNLVSTSHAIPYETYLLTNTNSAPEGAMGPGDQNTIFDMHVWLQQYSGWGDYDRVGVSDAFTLNNHGTTIGADKLIGEALAVGFNYTYARTGARASNGSRVDTETYWIGAYGEWVGVEGLYIDALAGYGSSSYDSLRIAENYKGFATYNGKAFGAYADVGQYYYYGDHLALSPYMGLHALSQTVDAHGEKELEGSTVHVDQVDRNSLESVIGLKMRHRFDTSLGRFQTTGYAEWSYDYIQDEVYSTLSSGDLTGVETARITPDQTSVNTGLGYSWICTDYMEIGIGYNGRFSDNYEEHTGSVMLDIRF